MATVFCLFVDAQDSTLVKVPSKYLTQVASKTDQLKEKLDKKSEHAIVTLKKSEEKIRRKLYKLDSSKAKELFGDAQAKYNNLQQSLDDPQSITQYIPYFDTLKTSLKFLEKNKAWLAQAKGAEGKLKGAMDKVTSLESSLNRAEEVKAFVKSRREFLKRQLADLPFKKQLQKISKQAYYYSAQISEYKQAMKDTKKLERKAIELLSRTKAFQGFMRKNSQLASLFRIPGNEDLASGTSLQGLQTRAQVNGLIQDRIGTGASAQALLDQNLRGGQAQLASLKEKVSSYSSGSYGNSSSEMELPNFKPNQQKTKSFLQRLEYGGNVQSQRARNYFPVTSDIGLSLGYKLNDRSTIGIGASYKLGLGKGWNHMTLSHQGAGLRSYLDYKLKGSVFLSGGYEQNYRTLFISLEQLKNQSAWQSSGLLGLSKKYSVSKKLRGSAQLLWDFLSYRQTPQTQAILFRVGYSLK